MPLLPDPIWPGWKCRATAWGCAVVLFLTWAASIVAGVHFITKFW